MDRRRGGDGREEKTRGSVTIRGWSECVPQPFAALRHLAVAALGAYRTATHVLHVTGCPPRDNARGVTRYHRERKLSRIDPFSFPFLLLEHLAITPPSLCYEHFTIKAPLCQTPAQTRAILSSSAPCVPLSLKPGP